MEFLEKQQLKKSKTENLSDLWDNIKYSNIHVI